MRKSGGDVPQREFFVWAKWRSETPFHAPLLAQKT
jgi:hypothetical protein